MIEKPVDKINSESCVPSVLKGELSHGNQYSEEIIIAIVVRFEYQLRPNLFLVWNIERELEVDSWEGIRSVRKDYE